MTGFKTLALLPFIAVAMTACAPTGQSQTPQIIDTTPQASSGKRCTYADRLHNYSVKDEIIYVRGPAKSVYKIEAAGFCPDLENALSLGVRVGGGINQVCVGDWVTVQTGSTGGPATPCRARVTASLTTEEIAALPEDLRV